MSSVLLQVAKPPNSSRIISLVPHWQVALLKNSLISVLSSLSPFLVSVISTSLNEALHWASASPGTASSDSDKISNAIGTRA